MQAEGIRAGDRQDVLNERGAVITGWTATSDAVIDYSVEHGRDMVFVAVRTHGGQDDEMVFAIGEQVPLSWGVGG